MRLYIDGVEHMDTSVLTAGGWPTVNDVDNLAIGANKDGGGLFNGNIDEVAIWNRTLSAIEIKAIYDKQKGQFIDRGQYESQIFDAGVSANLTNISWFTEVPY